MLRKQSKFYICTDCKYKVFSVSETEALDEHIKTFVNHQFIMSETFNSKFTLIINDEYENYSWMPNKMGSLINGEPLI